MSDEKGKPEGPGAGERSDGAEVVKHPVLQWPMLAASRTAAGIVLLDKHYRVLWANDAFYALSGFEPSDLVGQAGHGLVRRPSLQSSWFSNEPVAGNWQRVQVNRSGEEDSSHDAFMFENRLPSHQNGASIMWTFIDPCNDAPPVSSGKAHAYPGSLAGMTPVWLFEDRVSHALERAERHDGQIGLLLVSLDGCEVLRERLGDESLDMLQQQVGRRLIQTLRNEDSLSRLGQGRWGILIEQAVTPGSLQTVALRCQEAMEAPFRVGHEAPLLSLSMGIAIYPQDGDMLECLVGSAEAAISRSEPANYSFYDSSLRSVLGSRLALKRFIQDALHYPEKNFRVVYQPRVSPHDGRCRDVEAQLRLMHPELGELLPKDFLPLVAELGQAVRLDRWGIERMAAQRVHWQEAGGKLAKLGLSLDVSMATLDQSVADRRPLDVFLRGLNLDLSWLCVELDERAFIDQAADQMHLLRRLVALGVRLAVSHSGHGPVDIMRLASLPVSRVTLGRGVADAIRQPDTPPARGLEALARCLEALQLEGVVTGVSTETQREVAGCLVAGFIQGDGVCEALEAEALTAWLDAGN